MKTLLLIALLLVGSLSATDRLYLNGEELNYTQNTFHFQVGNNVWLETNAVHTDSSGLFTLENDIVLDFVGYQKTWRCPYCNMHWPMNEKCQNKDCPSKYL